MNPLARIIFGLLLATGGGFALYHYSSQGNVESDGDATELNEGQQNAGAGPGGLEKRTAPRQADAGKAAKKNGLPSTAGGPPAPTLFQPEKGAVSTPAELAAWEREYAMLVKEHIRLNELEIAIQTQGIKLTDASGAPIGDLSPEARKELAQGVQSFLGEAFNPRSGWLGKDVGEMQGRTLLAFEGFGKALSEEKILLSVQKEDAASKKRTGLVPRSGKVDASGNANVEYRYLGKGGTQYRLGFRFQQQKLDPELLRSFTELSRSLSR